MTRIQSDKVNVGNDYVIKTESLSYKEKALQIQQGIMTEAKIKADDVLKQAQTQAEQIIAQAQSECDSIRQNAQQQGHDEGFQAGYQEGNDLITKELEDKIINLNNFAQSAFELKKRIIKSAHKDIVDLVLTISDKICHTSLELNPQIIEQLTLSAINMLPEKESVNIIVNPKMSEKIYEISENLKEIIYSLKNIKIVEDVNVSADGTIVEGINSRIDSRISSQIDELTQKMLIELQSIGEVQLVKEVESNGNDD